MISLPHPTSRTDAAPPPGPGEVLAARLDLLHRRLSELGSLVVAFSGGADSALLLAAAVRALGPDQVIAATGDSASLSRRERGAVRDIAAELGANHVFVGTHELETAGYRENSTSRCWFCKDELATRLRELADRVGFAQVATGTNHDDLADPFRPGIRAAALQGWSPRWPTRDSARSRCARRAGPGPSPPGTSPPHPVCPAGSPTA